MIVQAVCPAPLSESPPSAQHHQLFPRLLLPSARAAPEQQPGACRRGRSRLFPLTCPPPVLTEHAVCPQPGHLRSEMPKSLFPPHRPLESPRVMSGPRDISPQFRRDAVRSRAMARRTSFSRGTASCPATPVRPASLLGAALSIFLPHPGGPTWRRRATQGPRGAHTLQVLT